MWITHIWNKPLASWTLLDVLGLLALAVVAWFACIIGAVILDSAREAREKKAKSIEELRRRMGYDN